MNDRERFLNVMNYKTVDRCVYGVAGAWPETIERWKTEGYDPDNPPRFDTDRWEWQGGWFFPNPPFEKKILSEDAETVLFINHEGITMRERKNNPYSSMPQFVKFPVETREEFRRFYKERMQPDLSARIGVDYAEKLSAYRSRTFPLIVISEVFGRWSEWNGSVFFFTKTRFSWKR